MTARIAQKLLLALVALALVPASALAAEAPVDITRFDISRYASTPSDPEMTQAGAHPNVNIYMQFCGQGAPISNIEVIPAGQPNAGNFKVTTSTPHGQAAGSFQKVRVVGVKGLISANSEWFAFSVPSATELILSFSGVRPSIDTAYVPGTGEVFSSPAYGCTPDQQGSFLKDFTLKLPPGFLGNPIAATPPCPTHLWLAGSCPDNTQLGHAVADTIPRNGFFLVPTSVFNLQTLGWEPARLGTEVVPGIPPGPLPNSVTLRTAPDFSELDEPNQQGADAYDGDQGDYGITSYQINIPKELGGNLGKVRAIDIVLCAYAPCQEDVASRNTPQTVKPLPGAKPFFVNPTSCGTKTARLESRSYSPPGEMQVIRATGPNQPISSVSTALDAVITTATPHGLVAGSTVTISGVAGTGGIEAINATRVVSTAPTSTTFTVNFNSTGMTHTANTGEVAGPPSGGDFRLRFGTETTAALPYNASAAAVQAALAALPSIGVDPTLLRANVAVGSLGGTGVYRVRFRDQLEAVDVPELVATDITLTPSGAAVQVQTTHPGGKRESFEDFIEEDLPVTGCSNVPFDLEVNVDPDDPSPGASDRQTISLDYPDYPDDPIWQSQLKDIDTNLPPGMGLAPGGGVGLKECSYEQFGVSSTGLHKQLNNDPHRCPEGSNVGDIEVETPVLPAAIGGKAFFGPTGAPGRPTEGNPWKLFLLLEGQGVRLKLVGDVTLSPSGQVKTVFLNNPETPFTHFRLKMGTKERAVLMNPIACGPQEGNAPATGYSGAQKTSLFSIEQTPCNPDTPFQVNIDEASADPEQAGAHSVSHIVVSRPDGHDMLTGLDLSLPAGAAGSLSAVAKCPLAQAQAGDCPASTLVGNIKTTLGSGISLFTVPGKLYLAEPARPGDVASIVATVPAKAGVPDPQTGKYPIDLGPDVVIINRLLLREADTGVDVKMEGAYRGGVKISDGIPALLEGVQLPIRKIEITVDREGFFLNPTGCDPRTLTGTFKSLGGKTSTSSMQLQATGCDRLPFDPTLYMIAGERGKTNAGQNVHPPLTAIVTQKTGEAAISRARVLLPNILRPNVPFLNEPGALCSDAQAQARTCPPKSLVGSARVITPVLPFELNGPVHIVQEIGSILPKLYVYLRGGGFEVLLRARNRITGVRTENTFDFVPDVPQSYFELKINGGNDGLLNNFYDLCDTPADSDRRQVDATFNGHNGATRTSKFALRVEGCGSDIAAARIASARIKVNRKGIAKVKVSCRRKDGQCSGRLAVKAKGLSATKSFKIAKRKAKTLKLKFSKGEVKKLRKAKKKQMKGSATTSVKGFDAKKRAVTLVYKRR